MLFCLRAAFGFALSGARESAVKVPVIEVARRAFLDPLGGAAVAADGTFSASVHDILRLPNDDEPVRCSPHVTKREILFRRQDGKCFYCAREMTLEWGSLFSVTRDHRFPKGRGGRGMPNNVVGACYRCNGLKKCMTEDEFRARYPDGPGNQLVSGPNPPGHHAARKAERQRRKAIIQELRETGAL